MTRRFKGGITVESGIPVPPPRRTAQGGSLTGCMGKYPWRLMQVGDSFRIPTGARPESVRTVAADAARRMGGAAKFVVRPHADGMRCWRVA